MRSLKKIELKDIYELSTMLKNFWKTQLVEVSDADVLEDIRRMLNPKCVSYLICYNKRMVGFIFVNEKYGYLNNIEYLYVKNGYRGKGLASFTLSKVMEEIKLKENNRVQIEVIPGNVKAIKLYHKNGFRAIDTVTLSTKLDGETKVVKFQGLDFLVTPKEEFEG